MNRGSLQAERERAKSRMLHELERQVARAEANGEHRSSLILQNAAHQLLDHNNPYYFATISRLRHMPVTIDEFVQSPEFLGDQVECWPALVNDLREMNPDILAGENQINEYLDAGATGTGKSFKATVTQAYQLYWLTCIQKPQTLYKLTAATPIIFMFQSVSERVTKRVLYEPFRNMFTAMPYTQRWLTFDKYRESELVFPDQNVQVVPALAAVQSMVGQAIISGILDEVNFMTVIENSTTVMGNRGLGGRFDQAEVAHSTISRRRKSRFTSRGPVPGCIAVLSSTRYKGDFLDRRIDQVEENEEPDVKVYRRKQYEVQPQERYSGVTFRVLVGTDQYPTRILEDHEEAGTDYPANAQVEDVPEEYYFEFRNNPESALRDVIGVATDVITPFITQRHKVVEAITRGREAEVKSFLDKDNVDLANDGMPQINEDLLPTDREAERFVHIDLSVSNDSCGVAMVKVDGFVDVANDEGIMETQPNIVVEMACSIKPSQQEHIDIAEVRKWVMQLIAFYDLNVYMISYDGFQSTESIQLLRRAGIRSEMISTERTLEPYKYLRDCFYQDRISMVDNEVLRLELVNLEYNEKKKKVDHPPRGSNDIADALCGAVFAAATSRKIRTQTTTKTKDGQRVRTSRAGKRKQGSRRIGAKR